MLNTLTIDLETTIRNTIGKNKASPFCPENKVVLAGFKGSWADDVKLGGLDLLPTLVSPDGLDLIVGQNFKFDIQYIRRDKKTAYQYLINYDWWDTSVAEYILSAQQTKYPSLDYLSEKYGGTLKDDKIKEYWKAGVDTTDIPLDLLTEYARHDVINTELVAHKQIEIAKKRGQYDLIVLMSNATKAYADMEYNGLHIDVNRLRVVQQDLEKQQQKIMFRLTGQVRAAYPEVPALAWNLNSNVQLSSLIFGGTIKWGFTEVVGEKEIQRNVEKIPCGVYKSGPKKGNTRYQWRKETETVPVKKRNEGELHVNLLNLSPEPSWKNENGYTTNDKVLHELPSNPFINDILELRKLNKLISTYCAQLEGLIYDDNCIHHNLNSVSTDTGRLSSSNPNMQNIPAGQVKGFFTSRFGDDGYIVQADYSQLEVVWQAFVSGDRNMKNGIENGIDFHCLRLAKKERMKYLDVVQLCKEDETWKEKRKKIKVFTFQRAYGAGAKAISESTGMSMTEVKELIKNEVEMYPQVEKHFKSVRRQAKQFSQGIDADRVGYYKSLTKRTYAYKYYEKEKIKYHYDEDGNVIGRDKGTYLDYSMSPTQIRNYDIQGGATGDLVPAYIVALFNRLTNSNVCDSVYLINTIHDSIMLDVHKDRLVGTCKGLKSVLEDRAILKDSLGIEFDIPLKVDIEYGPDWENMQSFRPEDFVATTTIKQETGK